VWLVLSDHKQLTIPCVRNEQRALVSQTSHALEADMSSSALAFVPSQRQTGLGNLPNPVSSLYRVLPVRQPSKPVSDVQYFILHLYIFGEGAGWALSAIAFELLTGKKEKVENVFFGDEHY